MRVARLPLLLALVSGPLAVSAACTLTTTATDTDGGASPSPSPPASTDASGAADVTADVEDAARTDTGADAAPPDAGVDATPPGRDAAAYDANEPDVAAPTCTTTQASVTGSLGGTPTSDCYEPTWPGGGHASGSSTYFSVESFGGGTAMVWGPGGLTPGSLSGAGAILFPPSSPLAGTFACSSDATADTYDKYAVYFRRYTLRSLSTLGTCADGKPVTGELTGCTGSSQDCGGADALALSGTLDGVAVSEKFASIVGPSAPYGLQADFFGDGALFMPPDPSYPWFVMMPNHGAPPHTFYCVDRNASSYTPGQPSFVLRNLTRVGTCAEAVPTSGHVVVVAPDQP
jgi:hypothetical protein